MLKYFDHRLETTSSDQSNRQFLLHSSFESEWQLALDHIELWYKKMNIMMKRSAVNNRLAESFPVTPRIWKVMSTYMSSVGCHCTKYTLKTKRSDEEAAFEEIPEVWYEKEMSCPEMEYPDFDGCQIPNSEVLNAFLKAESTTLPKSVRNTAGNDGKGTLITKLKNY